MIDPRVAGSVGSDLLAGLRADGPFGVAIATANSRNGGCNDWSPIRRAGDRQPLSPAEFQRKGRFALDAGLRAAASALRVNQQPANIVVVASGRAQCISVACTLSHLLAQNAQGLRIDVVATAPEAEALRCLADNTGGRFSLAEKRDGAADSLAALLREPLPAPRHPTVLADSGFDAEQGSAEANDRAADNGLADTPDNGASGGREGVALADSTAPRPRPRPGGAASVGTDAGESDNGGTGSGALAASPQADAPPEPFAWVAKRAEAAGEDFTDSAMGPGIRIHVAASESGPRLVSELAYEVLSVEGDGTFRLVERSWAPAPYFSLADGDYIVRVTHGDIVRQFAFAVGEEQPRQKTFSLDLGFVRLATHATAHSPPLESDLTYRLRRIVDGQPSPAVIVRTLANPLLSVPAGTYLVEVESGGSAETATLTVAAGETVDHQFVMNFGYLRLATLDPNGGPYEYSVLRAPAASADRLPKTVAREKAETVLLRLPAGIHIAVAKANGLTARQSVVVEAGKLTTAYLSIQTAAVTAPTASTAP